jgi:RNA polymerase sigma factor (TIGR02999 family)
MSEVTQLLNRVETADPSSGADLVPLVYAELRKLAAARLAHEQPGQTLEPTALVHEAYLRLLGDGADKKWENRGHFFAAAAIAMRRILVERARRVGRLKHGGGLRRVDLTESKCGAEERTAEEFLDLDEALDRLAAEDPQAAELAKLRYFIGLTIPQAAELLEVSPRKADLIWAFARAWLRRELSDN